MNNFPIIPSDLIGLKQSSSILSIKRKKRDFFFFCFEEKKHDLAASIQINSCIYYFCTGELFCICRISCKDLTRFSE